ncbi:hypothetical protein CBS101457_000087 [Exobasidium rhododendri]|nr:hypothetical protein CBS101457_000087 [Exobasidium rhododendri]
MVGFSPAASILSTCSILLEACSGRPFPLPMNDGRGSYPFLSDANATQLPIPGYDSDFPLLPGSITHGQLESRSTRPKDNAGTSNSTTPSPNSPDQYFYFDQAGHFLDHQDRLGKSHSSSFQDRLVHSMTQENERAGGGDPFTHSAQAERNMRHQTIPPSSFLSSHMDDAATRHPNPASSHRESMQTWPCSITPDYVHLYLSRQPHLLDSQNLPAGYNQVLNSNGIASSSDAWHDNSPGKASGTFPPILYPHHGDIAWDYRPKEYVLEYDDKFESTSDSSDELVWCNLNQDQKCVVVDLIHKARPYMETYIRKEIANKLTARRARALLSKSEDLIDAAVEEMYPFDMNKGGPGGVPWMKGLSKAQRLEVIDKVANATYQPADALRDLFLRKKITPGLAQQFLNSNTPQNVRQLAEYYCLTVPVDDETVLPWQRGASNLQLKAIRQRMTESTVCRSKPCFKLLKKPYIPAYFGLKILRADETDFARIVKWMRCGGALPPPV